MTRENLLTKNLCVLGMKKIAERRRKSCETRENLKNRGWML